MKTQNNFNLIAPFYDQLAGFVFGNAIRQSQHVFLNEAAIAKNILILGGGTGQFLPALASINPEAQIWYIDQSPKMIALAKHRIDSDRVCFIGGTEQSIPPNVKFDAVITFCYLDLFSENDLKVVLSIVAEKIRADGKWLVSDFCDNGKIWQRTFLKAMYLFFTITARVGVRRLPDWRNQLEQIGFRCLRSKSFYSGFIESRVYARVSSNAS